MHSQSKIQEVVVTTELQLTLSHIVEIVLIENFVLVTITHFSNDR